ncbi:MAG: hypothetical protein AB8U92_01705 [Francisella endosymbiont of Hyalomma scupense]
MRLESFPLTIMVKLDRIALPNFNISNIKSIILDPHIPKGRKEKYHPQFDLGKGGRNVEE